MIAFPSYLLYSFISQILKVHLPILTLLLLSYRSKLSMVNYSSSVENKWWKSVPSDSWLMAGPHTVWARHPRCRRCSSTHKILINNYQISLLWSLRILKPSTEIQTIQAIALNPPITTATNHTVMKEWTTF